MKSKHAQVHLLAAMSSLQGYKITINLRKKYLMFGEHLCTFLGRMYTSSKVEIWCSKCGNEFWWTNPVAKSLMNIFFSEHFIGFCKVLKVYANGKWIGSQQSSYCMPS